MNKTTAKEVLALRPYDILCGRSKHSFNNIGNRRFRITVSLNVKRYNSIATRSGRAGFIESFARTLKDDVGFRFFRILKNGEKVELTEEEARAKIGHALRDLSASLREGTSKATKTSKTAKRKRKAIKKTTMTSTKLEAPLVKPKVVTPTIKKETLFLDASAFPRSNSVAEPMVPSLDENNDSNNKSNNHFQEKDWNLPVAVSSASVLPSREHGLGEYGFSPLDVTHDDDALLPLPQQHKLEETAMLSDLLPSSSFGEYQCLRVGSMPLDLPHTMIANYDPNSKPSCRNFDTKPSCSSFFFSTHQNSVSTDDRVEDDEDLSVWFAHVPPALGRVVMP
eukprot:scaffold417_cov97-Cylindrotheca_fusiformis.AAC.2